jgi:acetyl-CoA carboxylase biotin carboxyl carrier protein
MDFNKIKELIKLVETSDITGLMIEEGEGRIEIKKQGDQVITAMPHMVAAPSVHAVPVATPAATKTEAKPAIDTSIPAITSPMTGTFYLKPSPDVADFVKVGDTVAKGQPVCIIEAMKTFNEIESEISGVIEKILVTSGQPVEAGQKLFLVRS